MMTSQHGASGHIQHDDDRQRRAVYSMLMRVTTTRSQENSSVVTFLKQGDGSYTKDDAASSASYSKLTGDSPVDDGPS